MRPLPEAMPLRSKSTITERLRPYAALFRGPRRDEEKIAQVWRREVCGIPTRWDCWLDRDVTRGLELDAAPRPGNVKCVLIVTFEEGAVTDRVFQEIDTYRLNIKVVGNADALYPSPMAVYKQFEGSRSYRQSFYNTGAIAGTFGQAWAFSGHGRVGSASIARNKIRKCHPQTRYATRFPELSTSSSIDLVLPLYLASYILN
ncbi:hypothetical protein BC629DRAFT_918548 [Irpex lacteus]|nr:hypothetical protein BC629DRAFT_918548 [Irpex lacteus]